MWEIYGGRIKIPAVRFLKQKNLTWFMLIQKIVLI
jgi:hypothetical protein